MYIQDINHVVCALCSPLTADKYSLLGNYCVREAGGNVIACFFSK